MNFIANLKLKTIGYVISGTILVSFMIIASSSIFSISSVRGLGKSWVEFAEGPVKKAAILSELRNNLGYGGMIHQFKNYVLRLDADRVQKIEGRVSASLTAIAKYKSLGVNAQESEALDAIEKVTRNYLAALQMAVAMAARGGTPTDIDGVVKIDDTPALDAMKDLDKQLLAASETTSTRVNEAVSSVLTFAITSGIILALITALLAAGVIWFTRWRLALPIGELSTTMAILASGDNSVAVPHSDRGDEIGQMAKAVRVFKENAIERIRLEAGVKRADEAIRESESHLRLITDALPILIAYLDSERIFRFANQTCADWYATTRESIIGRHAREILGPERYDKFHAPENGADYTSTRTFTETHTYPDGCTRDTEITYVPHLGQDGQLLGIFVLAIDATAQKRTEARLRQAQKMEAVGQLTSGVAHDFNNLLAVVLVNTELAKQQVGADSMVQNLLDKVFNAGQRGASLVSRLLAFSRQQPLQTTVFSLNDLVTDMVELVERALGETFDVQIDLSDDLELTEADASQMENALLNLSLNARDAMGSGGILGIRTANVRLGEEMVARYPFITPGDYVMLSVSDNGSGMPKEVVDQVFEPFFTTKDVGKGTGLGLSIIYGFVKQSGGYVIIDSEVGQGTTVNIYLPSSCARRNGAPPPSPGNDRARGDGETILVVEDDVDVRDLAVTALTSLGYRTLEADSAPAALLILRERLAEIDLLFSDIALPGGQSGVELADEIRVNGDDLKILLTTGYDQGALSGHGGLETGIDLLKKPYSIHQLATKVRAVLAA